MSKTVLSPKRLSLSKNDFEDSIKNNSPETQKRYRREWNRYNGTSIPHKKEIAPRPKSEKLVATKKKRILSEKKLGLNYDSFKNEIKDKPKTTQARYWRAWQSYRGEHRPQRQIDHPEYRNILLVHANADGHKFEYYFSTITNKKRLRTKDLHAMAQEIDAGTNVTVTSVTPVATYDNWTGEKV